MPTEADRQRWWGSNWRNTRTQALNLVRDARAGRPFNADQWSRTFGRNIRYGTNRADQRSNSRSLNR